MVTERDIIELAMETRRRHGLEFTLNGEVKCMHCRIGEAWPCQWFDKANDIVNELAPQMAGTIC